MKNHYFASVKLNVDAAKPTKKILIVEDNDDLADLLNLRFEHLGWQTSVCTNPIRALALLAEQPFDAMITDQMMPGMTGMQLIGKARSAGTDPLLIVLYTGDLTAVETVRSFPSDVWVVKKPADIKKLSADLAAVVESGTSFRNRNRNRNSD